MSQKKSQVLITAPKKNVALFVGSGSVKNSWNPILKAINHHYGLKTTIDGANCLMARDVYLCRFFASYKKRDNEGIEAILTRLNLLKTFICIELAKAQDKKELRARRELKLILTKFVFFENVEANLFTANWDTVIDKEIARILHQKINKYGIDMNCCHFHGIMYDVMELCLPSEHTKELYRTKKESKRFDQKNAVFLDNAEKAEKIILYGLSLDPLDAELSQVISACCLVGNLKEVIIINPDYKTVAERVRILNDGDLKLKITCYHPADLKKIP